MVRPLALCLMAAIVGCTPEPVEPPEQMSARRLLIRASLDLRGVRPSVADYARVQADPKEVDALIDEYLQDSRFGSRMADLWAEVLQTRSEFYPVNPASYGVDLDPAQFIRSVGDEPTQMIRRVADDDLPWTELVTGDWTMSDPTLAAVWPVDYPGGTGWQVSHYNDGRPAAGVLSTNSMWWRYGSTPSNANRKRANATTRIFLCQDYLDRPIEFDRNVNLLDQDAVEGALKTNPACVNCHVSLDPLASYFYGFWYVNDNIAADITEYHPERELLWRQLTDSPPGFYGEPGYNLEDLGHQLASDNRFVTCAVRHTSELLLRRDADLLDTNDLVRHREAFLDGDLSLRSAVRSIVHSDVYRAGPDEVEGGVPLKMTTPTLMHSQLEDLTGFRFTNNGFDVTRSTSRGFQVLGGGADGYTVTSSATRPGATVLLVHERLAEAAADHAVRTDLQSSGGRLLDLVDGSETPDADRDAMVRQIQSLHTRIFGTTVAADGPEVQANLELWESLYAIDGSAQGAWTGVVSVLLRDPDMLFY